MRSGLVGKHVPARRSTTTHIGDRLPQSAGCNVPRLASRRTVDRTLTTRNAVYRHYDRSAVHGLQIVCARIAVNACPPRMG
jgi:hypothetical protein